VFGDEVFEGRAVFQLPKALEQQYQTVGSSPESYGLFAVGRNRFNGALALLPRNPSTTHSHRLSYLLNGMVRRILSDELAGI
jgi:hypothetical protein